MKMNKLTLLVLTFFVIITVHAQKEIWIKDVPTEVKQCKTFSLMQPSDIDVSDIFSHDFTKVKENADLEITIGYFLTQESKKIADKTTKYVKSPVKNSVTGYYETKMVEQEVPEQWRFVNNIEITISYKIKPENFSKTEKFKKELSVETGRYNSKKAKNVSRQEIEKKISTVIYSEMKIIPKFRKIITNSPQVLEVGNVSGIKELIEKGQIIDAQVGKENTTLLIAALMRNDLKSVEYLLSKNADVNLADNKGWTPLLYAKLYAMPQIEKLLSDKGAKMPLNDKQGRTFEEIEKSLQSEIFYNALLNNNISLLETMIGKGFDIHKPLNTAYPVEVAAMLGNIEPMKLLLNHKADINLYIKEPGLAHAIRGKNYEMINLLLDNKPNDLGNVCLDLALGHKDIPLLERLLALDAKGKKIVEPANIGLLADTKDTALIKRLYKFSNEEIHSDIVYEFLKYADYDFMNWIFSELQISSLGVYEYQKMLKLVQKDNNQDLINCLTINPYAIHNFVKNSDKTDFNHSNLSGYLLYQASQLNNEAYIFSEVIKDAEIINNYLGSGLNLFLTDGSNEFTLLHYFVDKNDTETSLQLLKNGADATLASSNGSTPIHSAKLNKNEILEKELQKQAIPGFDIPGKDNMTLDYIDFINNKPEWTGTLSPQRKDRLQEFVIIALLADDTIQLKRLFNLGAKPIFSLTEGKKYYRQKGSDFKFEIEFRWYKCTDLVSAAICGYCWKSFKFLIENKIAEISDEKNFLKFDDFHYLMMKDATYFVYEYLFQNGLMSFYSQDVRLYNLFHIYSLRDKNAEAYPIIELFLKYGADPFYEKKDKDSFAKATKKDAEIQEMIKKYSKKE